ncbi:MAG: hypothetical protein FJ090_20410 [Deltaproteobacteria bacterium]|nr:hypothetical protein [Deltaproteobacteria bacterium]
MGLAWAPGMFHYVARAIHGTLLFRAWAEAARLDSMLRRAFPDLVAYCVMPDHVHLVLPHGAALAQLRRVMSAFARSRLAHRGGQGAALAWERAPAPEAVTAEKLDRVIRYVHLNPCRKHLVSDPLAWPFSSHRDFVGLGPGAERWRHARPAWFHGYVSGDPSVSVAGTPMPEVRYQDFDFFAVRDAVSSVTRTVVGAKLAPEARSLLARTAAAHGLLEPRKLGGLGLAKVLDISRSSVYRLCDGTPSRGRPMKDPLLAVAVRVVGDGRWWPLTAGDVARQPGWEAYRGLR